MHGNNERGIALVLALFLMSALTVLGASLMFLSQTETYASMNYRMMSQARYAGEAGVQKAASFLLDDTQYAPPSVAALALYDRTKSPVTCVGGPGCTTVNGPVILSANDDVDSNYPDAAVPGLFDAAAKGTLLAGNTTITFDAFATLLSMQVFDSYGGGPTVIQTWQITGTGGLAGARNATVEVVAMIETPKVPASTYGAFGTDDSCGALTFGGNVTIDSYDSSTLSGSTAPTFNPDGGNVGTNGNLSIGGSVSVQGNLYSPRTGVGDCQEGAVTALTETGNATVAGSVVALPAPVQYPTPDIPAPSVLPLADISSTTGACALLGLTVANCTTSGDDIVIDGHGVELTLPSVALSGNVDIVLVGASPSAGYNFNSISISSNSTIGAQAADPTEHVFVNVSGLNPDNTAIAIPIDFTGGSYAAVTGCATCSAYDASILQFVYGGTGEIRMTGNSGAAAVFYAPNASVNFSGTADLYGSVLAARLNQSGNADIHYDQRLQRDFWVAGHPMVGSFTWTRF